MSVKRPRIDPPITDLIEKVRGDVPYERFVNSALSEHLAKYRLDPRDLADLAADEGGLTRRERRAVYDKINANGDSGRRPREGLSDKENRAFDVMGRYLPPDTGDAELFRRAFWGY